jgi:hypothetical protein
MTLGRKDLVATLLTAFAVFVFLATHEGWNVWLVGSSHRWAAGAITLVGALTCGLGSPGERMREGGGPDAATRLLSLLVVCVVLLWVGATVRHASRPTGRRLAT